LKLHPLSLLVLALWLSTAALFCSEVLALVTLLGLCLLARIIVKTMEFRQLSHQRKRLVPLLLIIMVIQVLFVKEGKLLWGHGWYGIHALGLTRGIAVGLRLLILYFSAGLLLRLSYSDYDTAFRTLHLPEELGFMVSYAVHVIPLVSQRLMHYRQLLLIRGISFKAMKLRDRLKIYSLISLTILANVLSQSGIQAIALELRGFRSLGKRTSLQETKLRLPDLLLFLLMIVLTVLFLVLNPLGSR